MGITVWQDKQAVDAPKPALEVCSEEKSTGYSWEALQQAVKNCTQCELCHSRKQTVFGVGPADADIMFIGEAPGASEDRQGEPFVGRAGQLLTRMLHAFDIERQDVFITNVLKCRPPLNRDPSGEEVAQCSTYLQHQVAMVQPKLLIALGRVSARYLLGVTAPLRQLRGRKLTYGSLKIPVIVTYHPAYLLRNPRDKNKVFQDLQNAMKILKTSEKSS